MTVREILRRDSGFDDGTRDSMRVREILYLFLTGVHCTIAIWTTKVHCIPTITPGNALHSSMADFDWPGYQ
jgi:hypothetical protein